MYMNRKSPENKVNHVKDLTRAKDLIVATIVHSFFPDALDSPGRLSELRSAAVALDRRGTIPSRIKKGFIDAAARSYIAAGLIEPSLPLEQRRRRAAELLAVKDVQFVIDHTGDILRQAQAFRNQNKELSILLYATACEHKVNAFINYFGQKAGMKEPEIRQMIRDTNFTARCTWILQLLNAPPLSRTHVSRLKDLMDLRNEFVHYKWKEVSLEGDSRHEKILKALPRTLAYLTKYARKEVYKGAKL